MGLKWTTSTNSYEIIDTDIRSKAIITLDGSLRSVGDACDRVFLDKDFFWKIERNIGQDIIGTITSIVDVGGISGFEHQPLNRKKFSMILADRATHGVGENTFHITETATVFLGTAGDTISDINAKYSGMEVLYELAEPIITTLDNELQHLLNNIPSYEGDTYVHTSGGTVRPYLYGRFLTSVGSQVSVLGQRVQSAEVKIEPPAIVATVRESVAYQGDLSGLDGKIDGVEGRVDTAESKITPSAITNTVTSSTQYTNDISGLTNGILDLSDDVDSLESGLGSLTTRVDTAESKITPSAITNTVTSSTQYTNDISGLTNGILDLSDDVDSLESGLGSLTTRVDTAESKITPQAITQTVTESQTYKDDLKGIDDKITNPNLLPLGWVDKTSNTAETLYEETVHLEKGDYWLIVDYTTIVGNQGQLLANGTLVSALTGAIYSAKWTQATSGNVTFKIINLYGFEFHLNFVKLEQGDKYTGFMADDGDLKYQSEYISTVEQTASKIAWIVKSGTSASNMVLTDEMYSVIASNIELTADNIKLEGYTTINNAFQIDGYGNVKMFSGIIDINAQTWLSPTNYNFRIYDPSLLTYVMANHKTLEVGDGHYVDSFVRLTTDGSTPKIEVGTDTVLTDYRLTVSAITMNSKVLYLDNGYVKYTP